MIVLNSVADPDPDPTLYLDMFFMFSKINIFFLWHFLTESEHHMTLKIKDKKLLCHLKSKIKNYSDETVF